MLKNKSSYDNISTNMIEPWVLHFSQKTFILNSNAKICPNFRTIKLIKKKTFFQFVIFYALLDFNTTEISITFFQKKSLWISIKKTKMNTFVAFI